LTPSPRRIGLIAGAGELPLHFARKARAQGFSVVTAGIRGSASPRLSPLSDAITWISLGQLGSLVKFLEKNQVRQAVMHGKVDLKSTLKNPKFDWRAVSVWIRLKDRSGEGLLKAVAGELSKEGIKLLDARSLMEDLIPKTGWMTRKAASTALQRSIQYGLRKARILSKEGIGQSLLVKNSAVVAVEAVEGTDAAIERAGKTAGAEAILFKAASPRQDWRFDVPTIGLKTIRSLAKAKASGVVVESGRCFLLDGEKLIKEANRKGIFILAI